MTDSPNRITGRSAFLAILKDEGITKLFGNPGTTELPIMHALREHSDMEFVLALQEALVVAMADGYITALPDNWSRSTCMWRRGSAMRWVRSIPPSDPTHPMIITAGQQEQGHRAGRTASV